MILSQPNLLQPASHFIVHGLTLESLDSAREIRLDLGLPVTPDLVISDNSLPILSLSIPVDTAGDPLTIRLLQKC